MWNPRLDDEYEKFDYNKYDSTKLECVADDASTCVETHGYTVQLDWKDVQVDIASLQHGAREIHAAYVDIVLPCACVDTKEKEITLTVATCGMFDAVPVILRTADDEVFRIFSYAMTFVCARRSVLLQYAAPGTRLHLTCDAAQAWSIRTCIRNANVDDSVLGYDGV